MTSQPRRGRPPLGVALVVALALAGCSVGSPTAEEDEPPTATTSPVQPTTPVPTSSAPSTTPTGTPPPSEVPADAQALEDRLDAGGLTDAEVGYPRDPDASSFGLDAPTQDQCIAPDETDQRRVARVQHWWSSEGFVTLEAPVVTVSTELVVYDEGGAEAALAALAAVVTECPSVTTDDGGTRSYAVTTTPDFAVPGSVTLTTTITELGFELGGIVVAQAAGEVVGYVYVIGQGGIVAETANRVVALMAERVQAIAAEIDPTVA